MNIEQLAEKLSPWMRVSTWDTTHPLDYKRFHKALESAFDEFGASISYDNFKDAMFNIAEELYPNKYPEEHLNKNIERFASNAETISSYLSDTKT